MGLDICYKVWAGPLSSRELKKGRVAEKKNRDPSYASALSYIRKWDRWEKTPTFEKRPFRAR